MSQIDAAKLKKAAPGAALVLFAGPVFLFLATDLLLFAVFSAGKGLAPQQIGGLASELVFGTRALFALSTLLIGLAFWLVGRRREGVPVRA